MAKVILITGQSNAHGRADSSLATAGELEYHDKCLIWYNNQFTPLKIGAYGNNKSNPGLFGAELPIAMNFKANYPDETVYIIKHALGGVDIDNCLPGGAVYEEFMTNNVVPAINSLLSSGIKPEVYLYFSQGEADANESRYKQYNEKLSMLINTYRDKLCPDIKFIFPEIITTGILTRDTEINNTFKNTAKNDTNVFTLDTSLLPTNDNLHWNYAGVNELGTLLFDVINNNKGGAVIYPLPYNFGVGNVDVVVKDQKYYGKLDFENSEVYNFPNQNKGFVYIDNTLVNSIKSKLNNRFLPFHNLHSAIASLPADNGMTWELRFLKSGVHSGCELPFRNLEFFAESDVTIDFTDINQGSEIMKGSTQKKFTYNFTSDNIKLMSNYAGVQRFCTNSNLFGLFGTVSFDWKASGGNTATSFIVCSRLKSTLTIKEWRNYNTHGNYNFSFADDSTIIFEKILNVDSVGKTYFRPSSFNVKNNAKIEVKEINFTTGDFRTLLPLKIGNVFGSGTLKADSLTFNNSKFDSGVSINLLNAVYLSGETDCQSIYGSALALILDNFEGKLNAVATTSITTKGMTEINAANFTSTNGIDFMVKNGITVVNGILPSFNIIEKGILKINT